MTPRSTPTGYGAIRGECRAQRGAPRPQRELDGGGRVEAAPPELAVPAVAVGALLQHRRDLPGGELRVRAPDDRGDAGHLGRGERRAARPAVVAGRGPRQVRPPPLRIRGTRREDVVGPRRDT